MKIIMAFCFAFIFTGSANASLITYSDRTSFESAAGVVSSEDFESFVVDTAFHTGSLNLGDFSISMVGTPSTSYNFIDVVPLASAESNVNGSNHMRIFTDNSPLSNLIFTFDTAITAFGSDFTSFNDSIQRTQLVIDSEILSVPINPGSFFGFTSDVAFTSITFQGLANDVYGMDNVTYSAASVPEPGSLVLLGLGLAGLGFSRKKKTA